jgi:hypothetical protein
VFSSPRCCSDGLRGAAESRLPDWWTRLKVMSILHAVCNDEEKFEPARQPPTAASHTVIYSLIDRASSCRNSLPLTARARMNLISSRDGPLTVALAPAFRTASAC